jgi:hypothetical protein
LPRSAGRSHPRPPQPPDRTAPTLGRSSYSLSGSGAGSSSRPAPSRHGSPLAGDLAFARIFRCAKWSGEVASLVPQLNRRPAGRVGGRDTSGHVRSDLTVR